jgi:hypothetical protein
MPIGAASYLIPRSPRLTHAGARGGDATGSLCPGSPRILIEEQKRAILAFL